MSLINTVMNLVREPELTENFYLYIYVANDGTTQACINLPLQGTECLALIPTPPSHDACHSCREMCIWQY
jgi:hypothetical protein